MERGAKLRQLRRLKDLSQECIAVMVDISQKQVSRIENGKADIRLTVLQKWCEALGITIRELEELCEEE